MKDLVNTFEEKVLSLLLVMMVLLVFLEVVMRFGFGSGFLWAQELTLLISAWFVLFGVSYGLKVGAHIGVDALVKILPNLWQRVASSVAVGLCLVYCGMFLYGGWIYLAKMKKIGIDLEDMEVPTWIAHSILFIGMGFLALRLIQLLIRIIKGEASGFPHSGEVEESMHLAEELAHQQAQEEEQESAQDPAKKQEKK